MPIKTTVKYTPLEYVKGKNRFIAQNVSKHVELTGHSSIVGGSV